MAFLATLLYSENQAAAEFASLKQPSPKTTVLLPLLGMVAGDI